jgi:uncharacterized protein with HEPN domain
MRPEDEERLRHMLDAAEQATSFAVGRTRADLDKDRQLNWALVKAVEIIGEAAFQMSDESRAEVSQIPWRAVIAMRHRLVHMYEDINLNVLWKTVQEDLPPLIAQLRRILETPPGSQAP